MSFRKKIAKQLSVRYHAKVALASMLERHSEQWQSEYRNIPATLGMAELTPEPLLSMQLRKTMKLSGPPQK